MNMFKKNGGFTLVELIVVIAILAILAGVAVPVYSGYISKANEAADLTYLDSVKTAVTFAAMEQNPYAVVTEIEVGSNGEVSKVTVTASQGTTPSVDQTKVTPLAGAAVAFKSNNSKATWTKDTAKWVFTPNAG